MSIAADLLREVTSRDSCSFALLRRASGPIELLLGEPVELATVAALETLVGDDDSPRRSSRVLAAIPYRQITELGFACIDDGAALLALDVRATHEIGSEVLAQHVEGRAAPRCVGAFDLDDDQYAALVATVLAEEIDHGAGANFVLRRTFEGTLDAFTPDSAVAIFEHLVRGETNAYWTFLLYTPEVVLVGASPEAHACLRDGQLTMNPISGTLRYDGAGPTEAQLLEFLADDKETDELTMVLDEELKIMAAVCDSDLGVVGPFLKQMSHLVHTEYLIRGATSVTPWAVLSATMFCPTVTGSPLENATRVIARHERSGRGYYSGALALFDRHPNSSVELDSAILIRTAQVDRATRELRLDVGATLVRRSDGLAEACETRAKATSLLAALGVSTGGTFRQSTVSTSVDLHLSPDVEAALVARNSGLSQFWLSTGARGLDPVPHLVGRTVKILDAEDRFTAMLATMLRSAGMTVSVCAYTDVGDDGDIDLLVCGPGPGDPRDMSDPRIRLIREHLRRRLLAARPLLAVCLSHQVLAGLLDLPLERRARANQGVQRGVDLFGRQRDVGFYNSYHARVDETAVLVTPYGSVDVCGVDGDLVALRGATFVSVQFHPESVLTKDGRGILADLLAPMMATQLRTADSQSTVPAGTRTDPPGTMTTGAIALTRLAAEHIDREHGGILHCSYDEQKFKLVGDQAASALAFAQFGDGADVAQAVEGLTRLYARDGLPGFSTIASSTWAARREGWRNVDEQLHAATALLVASHRLDDLGAQACAVDLIQRCLGFYRDGVLPGQVCYDWSDARNQRPSMTASIAALHTLSWAAAIGENALDLSLAGPLAESVLEVSKPPRLLRMSRINRARLSMALSHACRTTGDGHFGQRAAAVLVEDMEETTHDPREAIQMYAAANLASLVGATSGTSVPPAPVQERYSSASSLAAQVRALGPLYWSTSRVGGQATLVM